MANTFKFGNGEWAVGKETALAYNDENSNFKPLPFTFDRASTATRVNKEGLIETVGTDEPRIDFLNNTKGHLLLEPSRTNLETKSNEFSTWGTNSNITRTANYIISPDGTQNAARLQFTANGFCANTLQATSTQYTISCYAKRNDSGTQSVGFFKDGSGVVNSAWSITSEWKRFTYTYTSGNASFVGIAGISGADISVYGVQLEAGSYATSYIPTQGSAVTRLADSCSQTVPDGVIGQTEGTMFFEIDFANTSGVAGAWSISDGSSANRITMNTVNFNSTHFTLSIAQNYNSGSTKLASANVTFSDKHKVAIKYSGTTLKLFIDGQLSDSVSTDGFGNYTKFYIGGNQVGIGGDAREFIQADLYNTALTDQELIALTQV